MRLVVFSEADFEPMTIVDVPHHLFEGRRPGDHIRLMPRMTAPTSWIGAESPLEFNVRIVTIRLELMRYHHWDTWQSTWIGFAADDGLTLKSSLLPGQIADYQWEFVS